MHCIAHGKGEAILFIHGMPTNHMLWSGVVQRLSARHRCFVLDLPGMGETPSIPYGPEYFNQVSDQIEALRRQHKVAKWHVVGHDAGAAVAVHYSTRYAQNVSCLALLSPALFPDLKPFFLLDALRKPVLGDVLAPVVHVAFWRIAMRKALPHPASKPSLDSFRAPFTGLSGGWKLMRIVRWGKPEEMLGQMPSLLSRLEMPTLIVHGTRDVLPADFAERAAALVPRSTLITLNSGHFIPLERSREVAASLKDFFVANRADAKPRTQRRPALQRGTFKSNAKPLLTMASSQTRQATFASSI